MDRRLDKARRMLQRGGLLLDIRSLQEWRTGHLCGAVHIPTPQTLRHLQDLYTMNENLQRQTQHLPKHFPLVLYCKKGFRAAIARDLLKVAGFTQVMVLGGVEVSPLKEIFTRRVLQRHNQKHFFEVCKAV